MPRHPASYRDAAGHVHLKNGRVLRTVLPAGADNYEAVKATGFFAEESRRGRLIEGTEVDSSTVADEAPSARYVVEHPRLEFISHPYEWSFAGLKAAALLTLDLHLDALASGVTMSDASAFNLQFSGPRPIFIDYLSFLPYTEGQLWLGYRQFCEQFLNPLLLTAATGVPFQPLYRGTLDGLRSADLAALLPFTRKISPRVLVHVGLQARMQRTVTTSTAKQFSSLRLPKRALENNLRGMRSWVADLEPPRSYATPWQDYERTAHYTDAERARKHRFVAESVTGFRPTVLWDFGCNSGEYSEVAIGAGAKSVIGFEPDHGALNAAFRRAVDKGLAFLPLCLDLTNPSPNLGWRESERAGLSDRRNADAALCLALVHHLVLGRNLPMTEVLDWLVDTAPAGVVEFVPKTDPMAAQLLALKPDPAPDYQLEPFGAALAARATIVRQETVTGSGRTLFAYRR
jgi:ribosomal protein L11 methylase PrmA